MPPFFLHSIPKYYSRFFFRAPQRNHASFFGDPQKITIPFLAPQKQKMPEVYGPGIFLQAYDACSVYRLVEMIRKSVFDQNLLTSLMTSWRASLLSLSS